MERENGLHRSGYKYIKGQQAAQLLRHSRRALYYSRAPYGHTATGESYIGDAHI